MADGAFLLHGTPPTPVPPKAPDDWSPYHNRIEFKVAEFTFKNCHMSVRNLDFLCDLMAMTLAKHHDTPPFTNHKDLKNVIDATQLGDVPWQCFSVQYLGERPEIFHIFLALLDIISKDPETCGSALVPIILGSNKTIVSVGTGNNEYYPLYASISNVRNNVQHMHRDALVIIGFLTIPKTDKIHSKDDAFRMFHCQLFHSSLSMILSSLKPVMTEYEVMQCGDGPYIADYKEQLVLSCVVKHWCPKCIEVHTNLDGGGMYHCHEHSDFLIKELHRNILWDEYGLIGDLIMTDIHKLLSFDLLHQLIKCAFKDHLVNWVAKYVTSLIYSMIFSNNKSELLLVASFSGLWRFPQGHDFKQWTGDDSKVLMKVFLPAIEGHVPQDLVHRNVVTEDTLNQVQDTLCHFHHYYKIFDIHSMTHYMDIIRLFSALNGLCSSITKSKHIKVVKELWWWSSRHHALGQMLVTNQHLDKLAASHVDFDAQGMLTGTILSSTLAALKQKWAQTVAALAHEVAYFLFSQLNLNDAHNLKDIPAASCPRHEGKLQVFNSAATMFYAPSDPSGIGSMQREHIYAYPLWQNKHHCNDYAEGMRGLNVARVICFFSFSHNWEVLLFLSPQRPNVLVTIGDCPNENTGMWMVAPSFHEDGSRNLTVIHIETVFHAAHPIPIYSSEYISHSLKFYHSLDSFHLFYVNKYTDHHAFKIAS
ncbi:hypothetical protein F4604DRAFT_1884139 [Suillus subluteus]|nr:hypothetical protein F4604DRAFT_1884139 [Suillus subluteus]